MTDYNPTFLKFKGPDTVIATHEFWSVLVRPKQCTLGSLVLIADGPETQFSQLPLAAFAEQGVVITDIENVLTSQFSYEKINYLMLMMVDPDVHYHVFPRYGRTQSFQNWDVSDSGWPGPPNLSDGSTDDGLIDGLVDSLRAAWPDRARAS